MNSVSEEYINYLKNQGKEKRTIEEAIFCAFYCDRHAGVLGVNFEQILLGNIPDDLLDKIKRKLYEDYLKKGVYDKIEEKSKKRAKKIFIGLKKCISWYNSKEEKTNEDQPIKIVSRIREKIVNINKNCKNQKKDAIFIDSNITGIWNAIEKTSDSKEVFVNFALNLYKLIYEKTRMPNPKYEKYNQGKYFNFLLPKKFIKNGTETRHFFDIVGALRHNYAHIEPEYNVTIEEMSYSDILQELLKTSEEPPDYQKLQIEILKLFEKSLKKLNDIVSENP